MGNWKKWVGSGIGVTVLFFLATASYALDVSTALSGNDAGSNIDTAAILVLGIAVTIFAARKFIGFFSR